jgi:large subunit ribosomal protein L15e
MYKYIKTLWKNPKENLGEIYKERLILWRTQPANVKLERPTRLDAARAKGYKAKQGFMLVRQRVTRGGHKREQFKAGRRSKRRGSRKNLSKNYQQIAEERANRAHTNLEVLNSYYVGKDKLNYWYEVIMVDPHHSVTKKSFSWMLNNPKRALRGRTSAAKKARGLRS